MSHFNTQVLIAGAGPVGMFTGLALARQGIKVHIVDTGLWPCSHSYALGLHPESLRLFRELGLADRILEHAHVISKIGFYDGDTKHAELDLSAGGDGSGIAVLPQSILEDLFEAALAEAGVDVSWRHELGELTPGPDHVAVVINRFERESRGYAVARSEWMVAAQNRVKVPFVIGADGHNSRVRRCLGIDFPELAPPKYFAVFEFKTAMQLGHETRIVLANGALNVLWPLPAGYCRWSFEMPDYRDVREDVHARLLRSGFGDFPIRRPKDSAPATDWPNLPMLTEQDLHGFLAARAPWFSGDISDLRWRTVVRFERRLAAQHGVDRVWLAGDAAHVTLPAGIQSMNVGFLEGSDLARNLTKVLQGGGSTRSLADYGQRWQADWRELLGVDADLAAGAQTDPWIGENAASLLPCLPGHGNTLQQLAAQIGLHLEPRMAATV